MRRSSLLLAGALSLLAMAPAPRLTTEGHACTLINAYLDVGTSGCSLQVNDHVTIGASANDGQTENCNGTLSSRWVLLVTDGCGGSTLCGTLHIRGNNLSGNYRVDSIKAASRLLLKKSDVLSEPPES